MSDLEQAISRWRRQMLASGIEPPAVDELESHLRDEIEQRQRSGKGFPEAFEVAVQHLGDRTALGEEFRKNGRFNAPMIFAFLSLALFVSALFLPLFFGVAYVCVVSVSVWEMSKLVTIGCAGVFALVLLLPFYRPRERVWRVPVAFGATLLAVAVMAAVYTFVFANRWHTNLYFDPRTLGLWAVAAVFGVVEGHLLRSSAHSVTIPPQRYV